MAKPQFQAASSTTGIRGGRDRPRTELSPQAVKPNRLGDSPCESSSASCQPQDFGHITYLLRSHMPYP